MPDRKIEPFNKGGVEPSCETQFLQASGERSTGSKTHHVRDPNQLAPPVAFLYLTIDQAHRHLPLTHDPSATTHLKPVSKMGRQRIEVHVQAIAGEERQAARSQAPSEGVDELMRHILRSGTELKHRKNLGERIDGEPEPKHLLGVAQPGAQFVQLQMRDQEMTEEALVQDLCMFACASEPGADGRLPVAERVFGYRQATSPSASAERTMATC